MQADLDECNRITDQLDALERAGRFESEEADDLRDRGVAVWWRLTDAEKDEARRYSVGLNERGR